MTAPDRASTPTTPLPTFAAVLFDLDGVLVDSEIMANRVWIRLLAEHGLTIGETEFMRRAVGLTHPALHQALERDYGWQLPGGFSDRIDAALAEAFTATPALEGAAATLEALRAAGVPYAVASNSRRDRLELKLGSAGLRPLTPHAFDPEDVGGRGKPLPDLYLHAAAELGVSITRCVVIEDSVAGVRAGRAAGATVWGLLAAGHVHEALGGELLAAGAELVLRSHAELRGALGL